MAPSSWLAFLATLVSQSVHTSIPVSTDLTLPLYHEGVITPLTPAEIAAFKPYTWYAATIACDISDIITWTCGQKCDANPTFIPIDVGGDGNQTQFCKRRKTSFRIPVQVAHRLYCDPGFSGYDPTRNEVIVSHQGTDSSQL